MILKRSLVGHQIYQNLYRGWIVYDKLLVASSEWTRRNMFDFRYHKMIVYWCETVSKCLLKYSNIKSVTEELINYFNLMLKEIFGIIGNKLVGLIVVERSSSVNREWNWWNGGSKYFHFYWLYPIVIKGGILTWSFRWLYILS